MIKVCCCCHRGWVPAAGEPPWPKCPTCRTGQPPLSRLIDNLPREEAERKQLAREKRG